MLSRFLTLIFSIGSITQIAVIHAEPFDFQQDILLSTDEAVYHNVHSSIVVDDNLFVQSTSEPSGQAIEIISLNSGTLINTLTHPKQDQIKWIEFGKHIQANEQYIAVSAYTESHYSGPRRQGEIHIYDAKTFEHLWELRSPEKYRAFGFSEGSLTLSNNYLLTTDVAYDKDRPISVDQFNLENGEHIRTLHDPEAKEGGVLNIGENLGSPFFGSSLLSNKSHIALSVDGEMAPPVLIDLETGEYSSPIKTPTDLNLNDFGVVLGIDDEHIFIGGSVLTNVNIMLGAKATIPMILVYDLNTSKLICTVSDPFPVKDNAEPVALAAAKGLSTPYYGSGFGRNITLSGNHLVSAMDDYSETKHLAGALAVLNKRTCEVLQIIESPQPQKNTNFGFVYAASETHLAVSYNSASYLGKVAVFGNTSP